MTDAAPPMMILSGTGNPELNGQVRFKWPDFYTDLAIKRRMVELANLGSRPGARPIRVELLDAEGQFLAEMIATLEYVIDVAPAGFYSTQNGRAELTPGVLSNIHGDVLIEVYESYTDARKRFRDALKGADRSDQGEPAEQAHGDGGDQGPKGPADGDGSSA